MTVQKEDLELSLGVGCSRTVNNGSTSIFNRSPLLHHPHPLQLNLMSPGLSSSPASSSASLSMPNLSFASGFPRRSPWSDSLGSAAARPTIGPFKSVGGATAVVVTGMEPRSILKGIDVNRSAGDEEYAGVSSPNSTISSLSGKRSEREATVGAGDYQDMELASSRGISDEEDGETSRKKLRLSKEQSAVLEENFKEHSTLNPKQKLALANRLGLRTRQVEVWFQNRRARTKLKQTEVDCEYLKRCCEQLKEDNKRLQKEVQDLRALKMSPQFYMQMQPPTTLTVCPSCERVGAPAAAGNVGRPGGPLAIIGAELLG